MKFVPALELVRKAARGGYAVPSFCVWNAETMRSVLQVATEMRAPVMLMSGPGEFPVLPPLPHARVARAVAEDFNVPAALHLDHGNSIDQAAECLRAGFTSIMLDFSARPYAENADALRRVVEMSRAAGATVEGEIGAVGRADDIVVEGAKTSTLTDPDEARRYAGETGVDLLAISIGNAHGIYTRLPRFDFERLETIHRAVKVPLVLHGGSGTSEEDIRRAISLGIAKVNVASELCKSLKDHLTRQWSGGRPRWVPEVLAEALPAHAEVVRKWIRVTGAEGRA
jgi:ketose-bisphosphate aldolase